MNSRIRDYSQPPEELHHIFHLIAFGATLEEATRGTSESEVSIRCWLRRSRQGKSPAWIAAEYERALKISRPRRGMTRQALAVDNLLSTLRHGEFPPPVRGFHVRSNPVFQIAYPDLQLGVWVREHPERDGRLAKAIPLLTAEGWTVKAFSYDDIFHGGDKTHRWLCGTLNDLRQGKIPPAAKARIAHALFQLAQIDARQQEAANLSKRHIKQQP